MQVYVSSCTPDGGIYRYEFDRGELKFADKTDVSEPKYTYIYKDRLYVLIKKPWGDNIISGVRSYRISENGTLTEPSEILPTGGIGSCHLDINENGIYIASYYSGSVSRIHNGVIRTVTHTGHSTDIFRQTHPYAHFVKVLGDTNVLICDLGCDEVVLYDKELNRLGAAKMPLGTGPRHLVSINGDRDIWVLSEMGSTLTRLTYDGKSLEVGETVDLYPDRMREVPQTKSAAIRVSEDGKTIYTSNRGFDVISVVDISTGRARLCGEVSSGGGSPRDFNISPDGKYMIVTNEATGIALMSLETRIPELIRVYPIELPLCVTFKE